MSKPNAKKSLGRTLSRPSQISDDTPTGRITPTVNKNENELKDDVSAENDNKIEHKAVDEVVPQVKPQSAGSIVRDAGQKLLGLAIKQEWSSVEPVLKVLEKTMAANTETINLPLNAVMDPVSKHQWL